MKINEKKIKLKILYMLLKILGVKINTYVQNAPVECGDVQIAVVMNRIE